MKRRPAGIGVPGVATVLPGLVLSLAGLGPAQQPAGRKPPGTAESSATRALPSPVEDAHLERLLGDWVGHYGAHDVRYDSTFSCAWTVNRQFLRLHQNAWGPGMTFEAIWFWKPTEGGYAGWWFNSAGEQGSVRGRLEGDAFVTVGADAARKPFRSTSRFVGKDEIVMTGEVGPDPDGKYSKSNEGMYVRAKPDAGPLPAPPPSTVPSAPPDPVLTTLLGRWSGTETFLDDGRKIEKSFQADWTLDRRFLLVRFEARPEPTGPPFEVLALWRADPMSNAVTTCSFDANGEVSVLAGKAEGETITLTSDDAKYGPRRTVLVRKGPEEFMILREQDAARSGTYRKVAEAVYRRKK